MVTEKLASEWQVRPWKAIPSANILWPNSGKIVTWSIVAEYENGSMVIVVNDLDEEVAKYLCRQQNLRIINIRRPDISKMTPLEKRLDIVWIEELDNTPCAKRRDSKITTGYSPELCAMAAMLRAYEMGRDDALMPETK